MAAVYRGPFGREQAERLLWRSGFGPRPGEAEALAAKGLDHVSGTAGDGAVAGRGRTERSSDSRVEHGVGIARDLSEAGCCRQPPLRRAPHGHEHRSGGAIECPLSREHTF
jgi:hypothetical protein